MFHVSLQFSSWTFTAPQNIWRVMVRSACRPSSETGTCGEALAQLQNTIFRRLSSCYVRTHTSTQVHCLTFRCERAVHSVRLAICLLVDVFCCHVILPLKRLLRVHHQHHHRVTCIPRQRKPLTNPDRKMKENCCSQFSTYFKDIRHLGREMSNLSVQTKNLTASSNLHYYVQKQVQNKCIIFL
jgi:hypothetical protein